MYALISVHDKSGVTELARRLVDGGYTLISTGGTFEALKQANIAVTAVEQFTGFSETLNGRVKTLHPKIHAGILADRNRLDDTDYLSDQELNNRIDVVVCNLYPFEETVSKPTVTVAEAVENIDIGGVTLIRAAAKNFAHVTVLVDPNDYLSASDKLVRNKLNQNDRHALALKAFKHTARYDSAISEYLASQTSATNQNSASSVAQQTF